MGWQERTKVQALIHGHHTRLRQCIGQEHESRHLLGATQAAVHVAIPELRRQTSGMSEFECLDWDACTGGRFLRRMEFDVDLGAIGGAEHFADDYLEMSFAFSCMLQADRGSFGDWNPVQKFDLKPDTSKLKNQNSILGDIRTEFQRNALEHFDKTTPISVVNAPTGIGKTKLFLDMVRMYAEDDGVDRVFYFSPLLALTDDFEKKINNVTPKEHLRDILVYNHQYSGSLEDKMEDRTPAKWTFDIESFNRKFVITTTQRLLCLLYTSPSPRDRTRSRMPSSA